jgi:SAM-dependent methyltransferase
MSELKIVTRKHQSITRNYLARVTNPEFPKHKAAKLAKEWGYDYWDGNRDICYGGYYYRPGYWTDIANSFIENYHLSNQSKILEIGCGKGFLLHEIQLLLPGVQVYGLDISEYAIENAKAEVKNKLIRGHAQDLPYNTGQFDFAFSINTFHNLYNFELFKALKEIMRVSKDSYICVESYETELQKTNLLYWQVTCESFYTPKEWAWFFELSGYDRDYEFIYFN